MKENKRYCSYYNEMAIIFVTFWRITFYVYFFSCRLKKVVKVTVGQLWNSQLTFHQKIESRQSRDVEKFGKDICYNFSFSFSLFVTKKNILFISPPLMIYNDANRYCIFFLFICLKKWFFQMQWFFLHSPYFSNSILISIKVNIKRLL